MSIDIEVARKYIIVHWMLACHKSIRDIYFPIGKKGKGIQKDNLTLPWRILTEVDSIPKQDSRLEGDRWHEYNKGVYDKDLCEFRFDINNMQYWIKKKNASWNPDTDPKELRYITDDKWRKICKKSPTEVRKAIIRPLRYTISNNLIDLYEGLEGRYDYDLSGANPSLLSVHELFRYWHATKNVELGIFKEKLDAVSCMICRESNVELEGKLPWFGYVQIYITEDAEDKQLILKINPAYDFVKEALQARNIKQEQQDEKDLSTEKKIIAEELTDTQPGIVNGNIEATQNTSSEIVSSQKQCLISAENMHGNQTEAPDSNKDRNSSIAATDSMVIDSRDTSAGAKTPDISAKKEFNLELIINNDAKEISKFNATLLAGEGRIFSFDKHGEIHILCAFCERPIYCDSEYVECEWCGRVSNCIPIYILFGPSK